MVQYALGPSTIILLWWCKKMVGWSGREIICFKGKKGSAKCQSTQKHLAIHEKINHLNEKKED